jgi:NTP pyrophosphatase (non-canonical NTP hydrolase)
VSFTYENSFDKLQQETDRWRTLRSMSKDTLELSAGASTEANELLNAVLKVRWGTETPGVELYDACADAVGDCCIFLAGVCQSLNLSFGDCVEKTWEEVQKRDASRYDRNYIDPRPGGGGL